MVDPRATLTVAVKPAASLTSQVKPEISLTKDLTILVTSFSGEGRLPGLVGRGVLGSVLSAQGNGDVPTLTTVGALASVLSVQGVGRLPVPVGNSSVAAVLLTQGGGALPLSRGGGTLGSVLSTQGVGAIPVLVGGGVLSADSAAFSGSAAIPALSGSGILGSLLSIQGIGTLPTLSGSGSLESMFSTQGSGVLPTPSGSGSLDLILSAQGGGALIAPSGSGTAESVLSVQGGGVVPLVEGSGTLSGVTQLAPVPELVWWVFDAGTGFTVPDQSGNGYTATIIGPEWDAIGLRFDAFGEAVGTNDSGLVSVLENVTAISISCWVKADILGHDKGFFSVRSGSFGNDGQVGMRFDTAGAAGGGTEVIKTGLNSSGGRTNRESSSNAATTQWTNYIYTWQSGQRLGLFINGVADNATASGLARTGNLNTIQGAFVGRAPRDAAAWYGLVYEVRIYNRVVTQAEAQAIYDDSKGLFTKPTHRIEAESMTLTNMVTNASGTASGGNYVAVSGASGSASTTLTIPTGTYDVIVSYYDENDGNSSATISVGANSTNLTLNAATGSAEVSYDSKIAKRVFTNLAVNTGDTFTWAVTLDGTEIGGFDYVEFIEK